MGKKCSLKKGTAIFSTLFIRKWKRKNGEYHNNKNTSSIYNES